MGIPFTPSDECLVLSNVYRVDEPAPFFSNISWMCLLPFQDLDGKNAFQALLTAFDTQLGAHVVNRFERTVSMLKEELVPDSLELIASERLPTLGITLRISKEKLGALEQIGKRILAEGVPIDLVLEATPISGGGLEYMNAGLEAASKGADLFCLALLRKAQELFQGEGDPNSLRVAHLNEALALQRLGQNSEAAALASLIQAEAEFCGAGEIADSIRRNFLFHPTAHDGARGLARRIPRWETAGNTESARLPPAEGENSRAFACPPSARLPPYEADVAVENVVFCAFAQPNSAW